MGAPFFWQPPVGTVMTVFASNLLTFPCRSNNLSLSFDVPDCCLSTQPLVDVSQVTISEL